jgi:hypothetical protein
MLVSNLIVVCLQALLVAAQTPAGFKPEVKEHLQVSYGGKALTPPGNKIERPGMHILLLESKRIVGT